MWEGLGTLEEWDVLRWIPWSSGRGSHPRRFRADLALGRKCYGPETQAEILRCIEGRYMRVTCVTYGIAGG